jgi:hypothetical protein
LNIAPIYLGHTLDLLKSFLDYCLLFEGCDQLLLLTGLLVLRTKLDAQKVFIVENLLLDLVDLLLQDLRVDGVVVTDLVHLGLQLLDHGLLAPYANGLELLLSRLLGLEGAFYVFLLLIHLPLEVLQLRD